MAETKMEKFIKDKEREQSNELLREQTKKIAAFSASFVEKAMSQLNHDVFVNLPENILTEKEIDCNALKQGIVTAITNYLQWDVTATMEFCGDLLEDVNAHKEAAEIRKRANSLFSEVI